MLNLYKANDEKVELLESKDFESSTNYIKIPFLNYAIVFMKKDLIGSFTKVYDVYRLYVENPFYFPIKFIELPIILCSTAGYDDYAYCSVVGVRRDMEKVSLISLERTVEIKNATVSVQLIAIGRYK